MYKEILKYTKDHGVMLVAVSKTRSADDIMKLYNEDQRICGENKVQELTEKYNLLPKDIKWHLIGHLQSNKVKYIAPFIDMIESVDSEDLIYMIDKEGRKNNRVISVLLQFHIAAEESKFGLNLPDAKNLLTNILHKYNLSHVRICGVMGMATFTEDIQQLRDEFKSLKTIFNFLKENYFVEDDHFKEISMGMSGDYEIAIAEGSTMVRIGSAIFGVRS